LRSASTIVRKAIWPPSATSTSSPKLRAMVERISRALALSSTTSTRRPSSSSAWNMRRGWTSVWRPKRAWKWKVEP
jgi:hypothetical protein